MNCYQSILLSLITVLVSACGQPGPLYLPDEAPPDRAKSKTGRTQETPPRPAETNPETDLYDPR
ncbi:MAG: LPS translocon maturation chaperone LptM [Gammaproteobacteria bacterium]